MASQYYEEHFTSVLFPIYSIKSCCESHSNFVLILNLCKCLCKIKMLHFLGSILGFHVTSHIFQMLSSAMLVSHKLISICKITERCMCVEALNRNVA